MPTKYANISHFYYAGLGYLGDGETSSLQTTIMRKIKKGGKPQSLCESFNTIKV